MIALIGFCGYCHYCGISGRGIPRSDDRRRISMDYGVCVCMMSRDQWHENERQNLTDFARSCVLILAGLIFWYGAVLPPGNGGDVRRRSVTDQMQKQKNPRFPEGLFMVELDRIELTTS